ncbi:hypothetical protein EHO59_06200 [Leptospira semungkisensis]|uniref:Uncharacterized protein n=1 Tax=Leptospira semungkisensis TaxID=2484985 RepID=A0A4V3JCW6_9LEPT|nr:hypothetical protein [Leptospira semungkisensis]TGK07689.1 hypothetical protein EHO59_06200 [Leptospira semungkisensis]
MIQLRISIFLIILLTDCYSYFDVTMPNEVKDPKFKVIEQISGKNIALIGFNSYQYYEDYFQIGQAPKNANIISRYSRSFFDNSRRYRVGIAVKDPTLIEKFGIGKGIADFPVKGLREDSLNFYLMQNYLSMESDYLLKTKQSSFYEVGYFYDQYGRFYDRDIDYYVVMKNYPVFQRSTIGGYFLQFGSYFIAFFTLNYSPIVDRQYSYISFSIYDKYLVLIDEYEVKKEYFVYHTFWDKGDAPCLLNSYPTSAFAREQPACVWESNLSVGKDFVLRSLIGEIGI